MSITAIVSLVLGAVGGLLGLVFGLLARKDRREGDEARALLGGSYDRIKQLEDTLNQNRVAIPTANELSDRAKRMLDERRAT